MDGGTAEVVSGRALNKLTDRSIKKFAAGAAKGTKLFDGGGLHLFISPAGSPLWRIKYRYAGAEKTYSLGPYPEVTLAGARSERDALKARLREGRDPVKTRQLLKAEAVASTDDTFEALGREWLARREKWSDVHREKSVRALERDVFPYIGSLSVHSISPAMVTAVIDRIAKRGVQDTAVKILQHITRIFRLAQTRGLRDNPATPVQEALPEKDRTKRRPALLKWTELGAVLRGAETARLSPPVRLAHRLCAFTAARISNIVEAEWDEFDLDAEPPLWTIPRAKMKAQRSDFDHKVILGPTIAAELRAWRDLIGSRGFVFPSPAGGEHITRESIEKAYRVTMGLADKHSPHGWRSALSTLARDEGGFERDVVELALDHIHDNDVVRAYDRGERLTQRVQLMQWWDAGLALAQSGAAVIPMKAKATA